MLGLSLFDYSERGLQLSEAEFLGGAHFNHQNDSTQITKHQIFDHLAGGYDWAGQLYARWQVDMIGGPCFMLAGKWI